ncbi:MAG: hypothetical protein K2Y22_05970 [Candidatus Obscuribacterales bacterium]|nr:hypothetical protein [Candidatus Obscuribacterales bacterium]
MDENSQRVIIQIEKRGMNFSHRDALEVLKTIETFIPDKPVKSVGGYCNFSFRGVATGDIQLQEGVRIYDNEDIDLTDPTNFARIVQEELTTRKSGLLLTSKTREEIDDQFFFEKMARIKAKAIKEGKSHVTIAGIGNWEMIYKAYGKKASWVERLLAHHFEEARVHLIANYALNDWHKSLRRYFRKAGEHFVPQYTEETFLADYGHKQEEITLVGYSLVLKF